MVDPLSLGISAGSFAISAATVWLTLCRSGNVKMTRPTLFYLGPDGESKSNDSAGLKIFLRALLYSTGKRGNLIENMYVTVSRAEEYESFNIWIYREEGRLSRGSGLFVDQEGKALDHHFLAHPDGTSFEFIAGDYVLQVYAKLVRKKYPRLLQMVTASLPESVANEAITSGRGAFFDWGPDLGKYYVHSRPPISVSDQPSEMLIPAWWPGSDFFSSTHRLGKTTEDSER